MPQGVGDYSYPVELRPGERVLTVHGERQEVVQVKKFLKMHYESGAGNVVIGLELSSTNFLSPTSEKVLSFLG